MDREQTAPEQPEITLPSAEQGLDEIRLITEAIRTHQQAITSLGKRRRRIIVALRHQYGTPSAERHVKFTDIADAMGTTDQTVYKILFGTSKRPSGRY